MRSFPLKFSIEDGYDSSEENPKPKGEEPAENKLGLSKVNSLKEKKEPQGL